MGSLSWPTAPVTNLKQLSQSHPGLQISFSGTNELRSSIVAVHGLGGDAYRTWEDEGKIWLRDFVPSQIPSVRVMSFGYDSFTAFSKSVTGIEDFAADLLNRMKDERRTAQVQHTYRLLCW